MKACSACLLALTAKDDDGMGKHKACPPTPDREAYLRRRAERMPRLTALQDHLRDGGTFEETLTKDERTEG